MTCINICRTSSRPSSYKKYSILFKWVLTFISFKSFISDGILVNGERSPEWELKFEEEYDFSFKNGCFEIEPEEDKDDEKQELQKIVEIVKQQNEKITELEKRVFELEQGILAVFNHRKFFVVKKPENIEAAAQTESTATEKSIQGNFYFKY